MSMAKINEENKSEDGATSKDIFGRYLFAQDRNDTPEPKEFDTEKEEEFKSALGSLYNDGYAPKLNRLANSLLTLAKQGKYTNMLIPPRGSIAYRFIATTVFTAPKILKIPMEKFIYSEKNIQNEPVIITKCPPYKPHVGSLSSWTLEPDVSVMRNFINTMTTTVNILLVAKTDENKFLLNPFEMRDNESLYALNPVHADEMETIGVGTIKIWKAAYIPIGSSRLINALEELYFIFKKLKQDSSLSNLKTLYDLKLSKLEQEIVMCFEMYKLNSLAKEYAKFSQGNRKEFSEFMRFVNSNNPEEAHKYINIIADRYESFYSKIKEKLYDNTHLTKEEIFDMLLNAVI